MPPPSHRGRPGFRGRGRGGYGDVAYRGTAWDAYPYPWDIYAYPYRYVPATAAVAPVAAAAAAASKNNLTDGEKVAIGIGSGIGGLLLIGAIVAVAVVAGRRR